MLANITVYMLVKNKKCRLENKITTAVNSVLRDFFDTTVPLKGHKSGLIKHYQLSEYF